MTDTTSVDRFPFIGGGSEMAATIRAFDWSRTPLGDIDGWPDTLKTATALILRCDAPMTILWGEPGYLIYNDGYARLAAARHPALLGMGVREGWPEAADFNSHVIEQVLAGNSLVYRDRHMVLLQTGKPEDVWLDLLYSPLVDLDGVARGVLALVRDTTQQFQVEQRLRVAQEAGGVGTFEWYPDEGRMEVSDQYRRVWGLAPNEPINDALLVDMVHPDDRHLVGPNRLSSSNPISYSEFRLVHPKTGEIRWIARRGETLALDGSGRAPRYIGIAMDITDRKKAEEAVIESEARWRNLFADMQEGFFIGRAVRDDAGRMVDFLITELNPAFGKQTGLNVRASMGRSIRTLVPDVPLSVIDAYALVLDSGEASQMEVHIPTLENRWFEARARKIDKERFAVLFMDISERKAIEDAMRESEAHFRTLAQSLPNHVWTTDGEGNIEWFNDRLYAYAGVEPGSMEGDKWFALVHPDDVQPTVKAMRKAQETGDNYQTELRLRRHDGEYRWHLARAVPIAGRDGEPIRWLGTSTDIDDQKAAEAALSNLAATLEERVSERTAELIKTQDALRQSQKMESIGNLTGGIAHDFNNLLQVVSGNLQLLGNDVAGNERAERRVQNAMAGVTRGSKLASQLLAFGRRQPLAPKVVNVARLIRDLDELLRRSLGEGIELETVIAGGLWNTLIDPGNVENALLNLALNARDAMDGQGRLTIEAGNATLDQDYAYRYPETTPGQYVMIAVSDTGCGMTPDIIEKVFEPFFTTKPEGRGTGLGLSMVYGFVKQSGGHVKIYSEPGHGTTIRMYLPRSTQAEDPLLDTESGPIVGGDETILVAEDDDAVRDTVVALLAELGYRVLKAKDAQGALTIIESGIAIDLLFTDVVMPGDLKSPELASRLRERLPQLAILFTSGYAENSIVHGGRLDEGVELLSKPYTHEALARRLRQVLDGRQPRNTAGSAAPAPAQRTSNRRLPAQAARPLHILLCEDDDLIRMSVAEMLESRGHLVLEADSAARAVQIHGKQHVDLLLTDIGLPDASGIELVQALRTLSPDLPVLFATGQLDTGDIPKDARTASILKPYGVEALLQAIDGLRLAT
ncbi:PAS domain S-box-containing protein [Rhodanobacter sp. K2T2]|uniref:hybrid sensor histidine kinase/response regulator n=1 Tax=Rhodanobacter sp. K2T2 TaxID=2723085 RepID=UPI0015C9278C|nr:PAS domain S-box protein [Rhodanobacter sp. K2T2]NYE30820.1 PAS domain S-box-containing protein [Rhodanobacter sp. K2T2]